MDLEPAQKVVSATDSHRGFRACADVSIRDGNSAGLECDGAMAVVCQMDDALLARPGWRSDRRNGNLDDAIGTICWPRQAIADAPARGLTKNAHLSQEQRNTHELPGIPQTRVAGVV